MTFLEKQKAIRLVQEVHPDLLLHLSETDLEEILKQHEAGVDIKEELLKGFGSSTLRMSGKEEELKEAEANAAKEAEAKSKEEAKAKEEVKEEIKSEEEVVIEEKEEEK